MWYRDEDYRPVNSGRTYKCGNCGRLLGSELEYVEHYRTCRRVPEDEPVPEFEPRPIKFTDYDKVWMERTGLKIKVEDE
jgi:hypothetical protein